MGISDEFILVKHHRRNRRIAKAISPARWQSSLDSSNITVEKILRKLEDARSLISSSGQIDSLISILKKCGQLLFKSNQIEDLCTEIVCYGIGNFSSSYQALYQLALLLELKYFYDVRVLLYDPKFTKTELETLNKLELILIEKNEEGKRKIDLNTIIFMPHCPQELLNNLLYINWGTSLSNCIVIANRQSEVIIRTPNWLQKNFWYSSNITPAIVEYAIPNVFKYDDVFNDLAIHVFPSKKLKMMPSNVLKYNKIPIYEKTTELIIRNNNLEQ